MKLFVIKILMMALGVFLISNVANAQPTGREIMLKVEARPDGDTRKSVMTMELVNKRGSKRVRSMHSYSKDYGKDKKTIMFFQQPADVKGTGFLTWDFNEESKTDDRWLYLPAMKKTRRISGTSAKKEYFMGSDFTYDDMGNRDVEADNHKLLREETINRQAYWVIESTPIKGDGMYSKTISWIRKDNYMIYRVEYFNMQGAFLKVLDVKKIEKIEGFWVATEMVMTNHQRKHKTIIRLDSVTYNVSIDESTFTVNALEKGYLQ